MGEVVNLRRARKQRQRADADAAAEVNRAAFGRTAAERDQSRHNAAVAERRLDGHKRDDAP